MGPEAPEAPKHDPEHPVEMTQSGSRPFALQNNQLLAQSEALKPEVMSCVEERTGTQPTQPTSEIGRP